jgi:hypothetical protein
MPEKPKAETAGRMVDAPALEWLTEEEAAIWLRVSASHFARLVDLGYVLGARQFSKRVIHYHWKGLLVAALRLELGDVPDLQRKRRPGASKQDLGENKPI